MNNLTIIKKEKVRLINSGLLTETDELFTKNAWRKRGRKVNKDESPITTLTIRVYDPRKVYDENGNYIKVANTIPVRANFYKASQVSPIKKGGCQYA